MTARAGGVWQALAARSLAALLIAAGIAWPAPAALPSQGTCVIVEGTAIAGVRIGAAEGAALTVIGRATSRRAEGVSTIYTLPAPWFEMVVERGVVQRVTTRSPQCRTRAQVGPGSSASAVRAAYSNAPASTLSPAQDGEVLAFPFNGISFLLRRDRVDIVAVFAAEQFAGASPVPAMPTAMASRTWLIRTLSARVDGTTLVVSGTVENRGRPVAVYAEATAFDLRDQVTGSADGPVDPSPVPTGGTGRFEARVPVEDVVRRYTVALRPVGALTGSLADGAGEVRGRAQFAQVVLRKVQITVEPRVSPPSVLVVLKNGSASPIASATVVVDYQTRCFVLLPRPGRFLVDSASRTASFGQVSPGGSAQVSVPVPVPFEGCLEFVVLSANGRIVEVRPAD